MAYKYVSAMAFFVFAGSGIELPLPSQKTLTGEGEDERYRKGLEIQAPLYGTAIADRYT